MYVVGLCIHSLESAKYSDTNDVIQGKTSYTNSDEWTIVVPKCSRGWKSTQARGTFNYCITIYSSQ